jgi:hypothetical protein
LSADQSNEVVVQIVLDVKVKGKNINEDVAILAVEQAADRNRKNQLAAYHPINPTENGALLLTLVSAKGIKKVKI